MNNISEITTFLGWCLVINIVIYSLTALALLVFKKPIKNLHAKISGVSSDKLDELYFNYLANYKMAILLLSVTPYLALKIMGY